MQIELEIDHRQQLVIAKGQGPLHLPDIAAYFARLVVEGTLGYRKIFDGRGAWLDLADDHVGMLTESVRAMGRRGPRGPVAIVATTPRGIEGARLFMGMPAADRPSQLFGSMEAARNWLALPEAPCVETAVGPLVPPPLLTPEGARQRADRARRLALGLLSSADRERLLDYARELDEQAARLDGAVARSA